MLFARLEFTEINLSLRMATDIIHLWLAQSKSSCAVQVWKCIIQLPQWPPGSTVGLLDISDSISDISAHIVKTVTKQYIGHSDCVCVYVGLTIRI